MMKTQDKSKCSRCNKIKDYGVWVTAGKKQRFLCQECYFIHCIETEEEALLDNDKNKNH